VKVDVKVDAQENERDNAKVVKTNVKEKDYGV
jgi:hypothetical protein